MNASHEDQLKLVADTAVVALLRQILERQTELERMLTIAFPGGDIDGHRRYHDEVILMMQDRRRMRSAVLEQVIKGSVWALLGIVAAALWAYFKDRVGVPR